MQGALMKVLGTPLDYGVMIAYFAFIVGFGTLFAKYTKTTRDFFLAGQRFPWWIISFSCVASLVGSYSFIKYSAMGYKYGFSSSMAYMNDVWWLPFFLFAWLPVIYFSKVISIPEYFEKRFDAPTRIMGTIILLIYLVGYVGINLLTLGKALHTLLGWNVFTAAFIVAIFTTIYVVAGGQTSVIWTDLLQAFILLAAGIGLFVGGLFFLQKYGGFWHLLPQTHKYGLANFNQPPKFNFVGIFWQDGISNTAAFWFMNQGIMMRFMSAKTVRDGRKALIFIMIVLMPLSAIAVSGGGWVAAALSKVGLLPARLKEVDKAFILAANILARPGIFGFVLAALTAALMSTVDTLLNAVSAVFVNDIWRPFVVKGARDRYYLFVGRIVCIGGALVGLLLVPIYLRFKTIYAAHGAFTAAITPPMVMTILLGCTWKRFTRKAAFWTLLGGIIAVFLSMKFHFLLAPFSFGVPEKGWFFMRALYGLSVAGAIGLLVTLFTKPEPKEKIAGLVWGTEKEGMRKFKGGEPNEKEGKPVKLVAKEIEGLEKEVVRVAPQVMETLAAEKGDLVYVQDLRWWLAGLKSIHAKVGDPITEEEDFDKVYVSPELMKEGEFREGEKVKIEKVF